MPKKDLPPQAYKTEAQLKEEARIKQAAEAEASAASHKSELEKKMENYWYHYKWLTIIGIFAVFLLALFIRDMVFRPRPDTTVIVISSRYIDENALSHMTSVLEEYASDFNGDNKIMVSADSIMLPVEPESANDEMTPNLSGGQQEMAMIMKLMAILAAGTEMIYLLDDYSYDYLLERGQGDITESGEYALFEDFSVAAEKLGPETLSEFEGMRFYLRTATNDESNYEHCKQILTGLDAN